MQSPSHISPSALPDTFTLVLEDYTPLHVHPHPTLQRVSKPLPHTPLHNPPSPCSPVRPHSATDLRPRQHNATQELHYSRSSSIHAFIIPYPHLHTHPTLHHQKSSKFGPKQISDKIPRITFPGRVGEEHDGPHTDAVGSDTWDKRNVAYVSGDSS